MLELSTFEEVAELVRAMTPQELGPVQVSGRRRGAKAWFGSEATAKEHYEAQLLSRRYVDGAEGAAIEVGFHSEYKDVAENEAVIDQLTTVEKKWRKELGTSPEVDVFFGAENWRRVSETWIEPDLDDPDIAFEIASRLVDYIAAIEAVRR